MPLSNLEYSVTVLNFYRICKYIIQILPKCFQLKHSLNILIKYKSIFLFI